MASASSSSSSCSPTSHRPYHHHKVGNLELCRINSSLVRRRRRRPGRKRGNHDNDDDDDTASWKSTTLTPLLLGRQSDRKWSLSSSSRQPEYATVRIRPLPLEEKGLQDMTSTGGSRSMVSTLPLTLGRVNLSTWWWNSCATCRRPTTDTTYDTTGLPRRKWKYPAPTRFCHAYCRPVAKHVLDLSKSMMVVSTKGTLDLVGRQPHLVSIIPDNNNNRQQQQQQYHRRERSSSPLPLVKIITIGDDKKHPWMKFQLEWIPRGTTSSCNDDDDDDVEEEEEEEEEKRPDGSAHVARMAPEASTPVSINFNERSKRRRTMARDDVMSTPTTPNSHETNHKQRQQRQSEANHTVCRYESHQKKRRQDMDEPKPKLKQPPPAAIVKMPVSPASVQCPRLSSSQWITPATITTTMTKQRASTAEALYNRQQPRRALRFSDLNASTTSSHDEPRTQTMLFHDNDNGSRGSSRVPQGGSAPNNGNLQKLSSEHQGSVEKTTITTLFLSGTSHHQEDHAAVPAAEEDEPTTSTVAFSGNSTTASTRSSICTSEHHHDQQRIVETAKEAIPPNPLVAVQLPPSCSFLLPDSSQSSSRSSGGSSSNGSASCNSQPFQQQQRPLHETTTVQKKYRMDRTMDPSDAEKVNNHHTNATSQSSARSSSDSSSILSLGTLEKLPSTQGSILVVGGSNELPLHPGRARGGTQHKHQQQAQLLKQLQQAASSKATRALLDLVKERNKYTNEFWLPSLLDDCKEL